MLPRRRQYLASPGDRALGKGKQERGACNAPPRLTKVVQEATAQDAGACAPVPKPETGVVGVAARSARGGRDGAKLRNDGGFCGGRGEAPGR